MFYPHFLRLGDSIQKWVIKIMPTPNPERGIEILRNSQGFNPGERPSYEDLMRWRIMVALGPMLPRAEVVAPADCVTILEII